MKKYLKKYLLVLTLLLSMTFAVPQNATAHDPVRTYKITKTTVFPPGYDGGYYLAISEIRFCNGSTATMYTLFDSNGNKISSWIHG